jgi:hypothetical protein
MRELSPAPLEALEFYSPFATTLVKAEESDGKWNVFLQASNEGWDQDQEKTLMKALKDQAQYYTTHGVLSWDHKHKQLHDPSFIIGEPTEVAFSESNTTLVKGILYKENKKAQGLMENLMSKSSRFGASIGGYILHKSQNVIDKVYWDETAITHKPVNDETLGKVQLIPFQEFAKALMAGAGVDAGSFTGGRALTRESLQGASQASEGEEEEKQGLSLSDADLRQLFNRFLAAVRRGEVRTTNDVLAFVLDEGYSSGVAADIVQFIFQKVPTLVGR